MLTASPHDINLSGLANAEQQHLGENVVRTIAMDGRFLLHL